MKKKEQAETNEIEIVGGSSWGFQEHHIAKDCEM